MAIESGVQMEACGCVFELDPHGKVQRFRYNNADRTTLSNLCASDIELFYHYQTVLEEAIMAPEATLKIKVGVRKYCYWPVA